MAALEKWEAHVKASVPPDNLLVFECREGWEPLCAFLGVPVPNEPFPHVNEGAAMQVFMRARWFRYAAFEVCLGGVGMLVLHLLSKKLVLIQRKS